MRSVAIDNPDVSLSVTRAGCANTAERIDVLFGVDTPGNPRNIALDGESPSSTACRDLGTPYTIKTSDTAT